MRLRIFSIVLIVWVLSNCAPVPKPPEPEPPPAHVLLPPEPVEQPPAPIPPQPEPQPLVHEVRWSGETLSHIAQWYTGNEDNWRKISKANPGLKPDRIFIGDRIIIPPELLITRKPMPRKQIKPVIQPARSASPQAREAPEKRREEGEMFGPVEALTPPDSTGQTELFGPVDPGSGARP